MVPGIITAWVDSWHTGSMATCWTGTTTVTREVDITTVDFGEMTFAVE